MWFVFALLSAVFAALTSILAKVGIDGVNSNLATAVRTVVVVLMAWGMVFLTNAQGGIGDISRKSWLFLILSGLATGASWLCYYKALQMGEASKVVPIDKLSVVITLVLAFVFLREQFTVKSLIGCVLITIGTLVMVLRWRTKLRTMPEGMVLSFISRCRDRRAVGGSSHRSPASVPYTARGHGAPSGGRSCWPPPGE